MVIASGVGQRGMEVERFVGVVPQRPDGIRRLPPLPFADRLPRLIAVDRRLGGEPRRVRQQIQRRRNHAEDVGRRSDIASQHPGPGPLYPVGPASRDVHAQRHQPEEHHVVQPGPFRRARQAQQHSGAEPPPPHAEPWTPRGVVDPTVQPRNLHAHPDLVAIDHQRAEGPHHEHRHENVEQCGAAGHEADAVGDDEQTGDGADHGRAADPPDDAGHQHRQDHPEHGCAEPPAQAGVAAYRLAEGDQVLAQRGVHHQTEARVVLHSEVVQQLPGLRRVVLLVEDRGAGVGGEAEIHEPGQRGQGGHDRGCRPALRRVAGPEVGSRNQRSGADDGDLGLRAALIRLEVLSRDGHRNNRRV